MSVSFYVHFTLYIHDFKYNFLPGFTSLKEVWALLTTPVHNVIFQVYLDPHQTALYLFHLPNII